jgi:hypothetical protein
MYGDLILSSKSLKILGESSAGIPYPSGPRYLYRFEAFASGKADLLIAHTGKLPEGLAIPAFHITGSFK